MVPVVAELRAAPLTLPYQFFPISWGFFWKSGQTIVDRGNPLTPPPGQDWQPGQGTSAPPQDSGVSAPPPRQDGGIPSLPPQPGQGGTPWTGQRVTPTSPPAPSGQATLRAVSLLRSRRRTFLSVMKTPCFDVCLKMLSRCLEF